MGNKLCCAAVKDAGIEKEPTVQITSNVKNDKGIGKRTAKFAMEGDLNASVKNGEMTLQRKEELLSAIEAVAAKLKKEANN